MMLAPTAGHEAPQTEVTWQLVVFFFRSPQENYPENRTKSPIEVPGSAQVSLGIFRGMF